MVCLYISLMRGVVGRVHWGVHSCPGRHNDDGFRKPMMFSKTNAIDTLVSHDWNRAFVVPAAAMFLDIAMPDEQLKSVRTPCSVWGYRLHVWYTTCVCVPHRRAHMWHVTDNDTNHHHHHHR